MRNFILILLSLTLIGCKSDGSSSNKPNSAPPAPPTEEPATGGISFAPMPGGPVTALRVARAAVSDFQLGDIKATTTYLFMLRNTGITPVTNIQLATTNSSVEIVPNTIGILSPDGQGGLAPIIQVTVKHGSGANNFGYAPLLTAGDISFNISASGADAQSTVLASATLRGYVRVANFTIKKLPYAGTVVTDQAATPSESVDLRATSGNGGYFETGYEVDTPMYDDYYMTASAPDATRGISRLLTNTGNTDLVINLDDAVQVAGSSRVTGVTRVTVTVAPGDTFAFRTSLFTDGSNPGFYAQYMSAICVWSQGTVYVPAGLPPVDDDRVRLNFRELALRTSDG